MPSVSGALQAAHASSTLESCHQADEAEPAETVNPGPRREPSFFRTLVFYTPPVLQQSPSPGTQKFSSACDPECSACDLAQRTQQAIDLRRVVVVHRSDAHDAPALGEAEPFHQGEGIVMARPGEDS